MSVLRLSRLPLASAFTFLALAITGCAFNGGSAALAPAGSGSTTSGIGAPRATLGGKVFGGQQPIVGASVTLWAAGTSASYGTGATSIATSVTDANGSFSFNSAGVSPCTTGQLLYITSVGGDPGGGVNSYAALMAALPTPCGSSTANTFVNINEITTVASVTALQQFMSIAPGGSPAWVIGAPALNVVGLTNAFVQVGNLASISTGSSSPITAASTINSVTYTTTITPDSTKINTLANILAACINTNGNSTCTSLFADATPGTSIAPTDTIQAMYYLATNAGGVGLPAHGASQGEPYYLCSTYISATPPFQPSGACSNTSTTYPTDWAIGVGWSTSNGSATVGTANTYGLAIDGNGNIWTAYSVVSGSTTNAANITEFNQAGQVQFTPVTSTTISAGPTTQKNGGTPTTYTPNFTSVLTGSSTYSVVGGRGLDLAIDTGNNAWFSSSYGAVPPVSVADASVLTQVSPTGSSTGWLIPALAPGPLAIDGSNNIYVTDEPLGLQSTSFRSYTSELEYTSGTYAVFDGGLDRQTTVGNVVWADNFGYAWSVASSGKCTAPGTIYRGNTAEFEADGALGVSTDDITNSSACPYWGGFADGSGGAYVTQGGTGSLASYTPFGLYHIAISGGSASKTAPVVGAETAGTGTSNGGLDGAAGTFVDGLGDIWVANSVGGVSEFTYSSGTNAFTPLSPSGTATVPVYGFGTSSLTGTAPYYVAADASGNL